MNRLNINLQTAARQGYQFAIIGPASWLGAGSTVQYIVTKHKTEAAACRQLKKLPSNIGFRIVPTQ